MEIRFNVIKYKDSLGVRYQISDDLYVIFYFWYSLCTATKGGKIVHSVPSCNILPNSKRPREYMDGLVTKAFTKYNFEELKSIIYNGKI